MGALVPPFPLLSQVGCGQRCGPSVTSAGIMPSLPMWGQGCLRALLSASPHHLADQVLSGWGGHNSCPSQEQLLPPGTWAGAWVEGGMGQLSWTWPGLSCSRSALQLFYLVSFPFPRIGACGRFLIAPGEKGMLDVLERFELESADGGHGTFFPGSRPQLPTLGVSERLGPSRSWGLLLPAPRACRLPSGAGSRQRPGEQPCSRCAHTAS